jgi:O-antigen/teichoic acid export membrane protein
LQRAHALREKWIRAHLWLAFQRYASGKDNDHVVPTTGSQLRDTRMTPNHTSRAAGAVFWSGIEISARYSVQILVTIFLARLLSPGDFGLLAMLLVFTNVGILLADAGFGTALVQKRHTSVDDESTVFWFNLFVGLLCTAALWFGAHAVAAFYQQPALTSLTRAMPWQLSTNSRR